MIMMTMMMIMNMIMEEINGVPSFAGASLPPLLIIVAIAISLRAISTLHHLFCTGIMASIVVNYMHLIRFTIITIKAMA